MAPDLSPTRGADSPSTDEAGDVGPEAARAALRLELQQMSLLELVEFGAPEPRASMPLSAELPISIQTC